MIEVPYGENPKETATLLLAAAIELGIDKTSIRTAPRRDLFVVPDEVAYKALGTEPEGEAPAKKAATKKTPTKKSATKKTAAKRAATNKKEGSK